MTMRFARKGWTLAVSALLAGCSSPPSSVAGPAGTSLGNPEGGAAAAPSGANAPSISVDASIGSSSSGSSSGPFASGSSSGLSSSGASSGSPASGSSASASGSSAVSNSSGEAETALEAGTGQNVDSGPVTLGTPGVWTMVDATQVKLLPGSPFYDRQQLHRTGYLATWNPDVLLYLFRKLAKLPQAAGITAGYAGWDTTTLKGHITGHFLSAASRMAVDTGDATYSAKVNYLVTELGKVQDALSGGYLAAFAQGDGSVSAPYYVHHKILQGLVDAYVYLGNQQALTIAVKFAQYLNTSLASTSYAGDSELGAVTDVLTEMYQITKNTWLLPLAKKFEPSSFITPLASNQDQLKGLHGNMHVAFIVGSARYANQTGDVTETSASANFWNIVTAHHSYVNGGDTVHEWFDAPDVEGNNVPYSTTESCNSHNMLKITARLMERSPRVDLGDYFERTLYNHILATVAPDTGRVTYFEPMHGDFRTYLDGTYCCVGTGLENTGRYNEAIYYKNDDQLLVDLYIPSTFTWTERGMVLQQQGYLPTTDTVTFTVTQAAAPVAANIQFRIPQWVAAPVGLTINGQVQTPAPQPSGFLSVNRTWKTGDVLTLTLPAALRVEHAKDVSSMIAVFYGPVLLAGELGSANMPNDVATSQDAYKSVAPVNVPSIVNASASPSSWLTMTDPSNLTFTMHDAGAASGLTLAPLYSVHHQRYAVYWTYQSH